MDIDFDTLEKMVRNEERGLDMIGRAIGLMTGRLLTGFAIGLGAAMGFAVFG